MRKWTSRYWQINMTTFIMHIGGHNIPEVCRLTIQPESVLNARRLRFMRQSRSMLCIQYVSVCLCMRVWVSGRYSSSGPWKLLHFGRSMTDVSYIRPPFLLCNCVCIVLQQKLDWRGESGRKTPEDMQASEVQWMKYSVGTALGKLTSTVLGNALGTAQGGARCFLFFFHSCSERYAGAFTD